MTARVRLLNYVSDCRRQYAVPDAEFAAAIGIELDELRSYDSGDALVPVDLLAVMLRWAVEQTKPSRKPGPGLSESGTRFEAEADERANQAVTLVRNFSQIADPVWRQHVLDLAAALAQSKR